MTDQPSDEALLASETWSAAGNINQFKMLAAAFDSFAAAAVERAVQTERERCECLARGEGYKEHYRTWPWYGPGECGAQNDRTRFCDALADAIRDGSQPRRRSMRPTMN